MNLILKGDIENLINGQKSAIRLYLYFAIGIFSFGVILFLFSNKIAFNDTVKSIINIAGVFVSSLSSFPIKEIINRKDKIGTFEIIKLQLIKIHESSENIDVLEKQKHNELLWKILEKTALN